jgi:hypothetical protein
MATYMGCSSNCFVLALVIIDALLFKRGSDVRYLLVPSSMHRLVLGSVVVAIKFLEDSFRSNRFYAKVGGIDVGEFNRIESLLVFELDYELLSIASHFHRYSERLHYLIASSAAARAVSPTRAQRGTSICAHFSRSPSAASCAPAAVAILCLACAISAWPAPPRRSRSSRRATPSSHSSVAALVGSPKPRHGSLRASSSSTAASKRSGSPPSGAATSAAARAAHDVARRDAAQNRLGVAQGLQVAARRVVVVARRRAASCAAASIAGGSATDDDTATTKRTSPVSLVRASRSPPSELDRVVKLNRVQSTELTIDVFRTRAAPPARRISSSPAQLGPGGGGRVMARSQLSMISTVVSTTADRRKQRRVSAQSLDDVRRHPQRRPTTLCRHHSYAMHSPANRIALVIRRTRLDGVSDISFFSSSFFLARSTVKLRAFALFSFYS